MLRARGTWQEPFCPVVQMQLAIHPGFTSTETDSFASRTVTEATLHKERDGIGFVGQSGASITNQGRRKVNFHMKLLCPNWKLAVQGSSDAIQSNGLILLILRA